VGLAGLAGRFPLTEQDILQADTTLMGQQGENSTRFKWDIDSGQVMERRSRCPVSNRDPDRVRPRTG
jgi:hypothetical protein